MSDEPARMPLTEKELREEEFTSRRVWARLGHVPALQRPGGGRSRRPRVLPGLRRARPGGAVMPLTLRCVLHADLVGHGYLWAHEILDGDQVVGTLTVERKTRRAQEVATYALLGRDGTPEREFATAAAFKTAYLESIL